MARETVTENEPEWQPIVDDVFVSRMTGDVAVALRRRAHVPPARKAPRPSSVPVRLVAHLLS
jgi:hypothetical protein